MRIVWKEESGHAVAASLEQVLEGMEQCDRAAEAVRAALREADPDNSSELLRKLSAKFEGTMRRLARAAERAEHLEGATKRMIQLFEDSEGEAIRQITNLDPGHGRQDDAGPRVTRGAGMPVERVVTSPVRLPKARVAPQMRFSALGPVMGWLAEEMNRM